MWNWTQQINAIARRDASLSTCAQTCIDNSLIQDPCDSTCGLLCVCKDVAAWPPISTCLLTQCQTTDVANFQVALSSCAIWIVNCSPSTSQIATTFSIQEQDTLGTPVSVGATTTLAAPTSTETTPKASQWSSPEWRTSSPTVTSGPSTNTNPSADFSSTITPAPTLPSSAVSTSSNLCSSPFTSTLSVMAAQSDASHVAAPSDPVVISSATLGVALFVTLLLTLYLYVQRHHRQVDAQSITAQPLTITFASDDVLRLRERERSWAESRGESEGAWPRASVSSTYWSSSTMPPPQPSLVIVPSAVAASAGSLPPSYRATMSGRTSRARPYDTRISRDSVSLSPCRERRESSMVGDEPADHEDDGEPSSYYSARNRSSTRLSEPHPVDAAENRQVGADGSPPVSVSVQEQPQRRFLPVLMQESETGRSEVPPPYEASS